MLSRTRTGRWFNEAVSNGGIAALLGKSQLNPCFASIRCASHAASQKPRPKTTPLYDLHVAKEGKMVEFAGWQMPMTYGAQSISESHLHTRKHVSIFDVSHMQQLIISGNDRHEFWETVCVSDVREHADNAGALSVLTNEKGGIIDDTVWMNTNRGYMYVVVNAGCADKDVDHLTWKMREFQKKGKAVNIAIITAQERALIAVQGPEMAQVLQAGLSDPLEKLSFMHTTLTSLFNFKCRITRCGYTGEDGVEISCLASDAIPLCETLLASTQGNVQMAGLGARDTLRLEAGLCLYGNDIDEDTTPIEAGLAWTIGKRRRGAGGFPGDKIILEQLKNGPARKRVGMISTGAPARSSSNFSDVIHEGYPVVDDAGSQVGIVTSGCPSPSLGKNISMAYVTTPHSKIGSRVQIKVRNQNVPGEIVKMPFVPSNYFHAKGHSPK